jgi:hypothetical protein
MISSLLRTQFSLTPDVRNSDGRLSALYLLFIGIVFFSSGLPAWGQGGNGPSEPGANRPTQAELQARVDKLRTELDSAAAGVYGAGGDVIEHVVNATVKMSTLNPDGSVVIDGLGAVALNANDVKDAHDAYVANDWKTALDKTYSVVSDIAKQILPKPVQDAADFTYTVSKSSPGTMASVLEYFGAQAKVRAVFDQWIQAKQDLANLQSGGISILTQSDIADSLTFDPSTLTPAEMAARERNQAIIARETLNHTQHADGTSDATDLDKALNESMTREMGPKNPYLPDFLIPSATSGDTPRNYICQSGPCTLEQWTADPTVTLPELKKEMQNLRQQLGSSEQDVGRAQDELRLEKQKESAAQTSRAQETIQITIPIPPGWVPCTCPDQHPGAGIFVNGIQYHTPALRCR